MGYEAARGGSGKVYRSLAYNDPRFDSVEIHAMIRHAVSSPTPSTAVSVSLEPSPTVEIRCWDGAERRHVVVSLPLAAVSDAERVSLTAVLMHRLVRQGVRSALSLSCPPPSNSSLTPTLGSFTASPPGYSPSPSPTLSGSSTGSRSDFAAITATLAASSGSNPSPSASPALVPSASRPATVPILQRQTKRPRAVAPVAATVNRLKRHRPRGMAILIDDDDGDGN